MITALFVVEVRSIAAALVLSIVDPPEMTSGPVPSAELPGPVPCALM